MHPTLRAHLIALLATGTVAAALSAAVFLPKLVAEPFVLDPATMAAFPDPTAADSSAVPSSAQPQEYTSGRVRIASLGIDAPVVYGLTSTVESAFQAALAYGTVHYPGTALPGQHGNAYVFGHSSDFARAPGSYKTVFAKLPDAKVGEHVEMVRPDGTSYDFVIRETRVIAKDDRSVLSQSNGDRQLLTLQTSYPIGTALKRFVVIAELAQ
jgi:LPXTG-site transpeptidase (sortase) family protein